MRVSLSLFYLSRSLTSVDWLGLETGFKLVLPAPFSPHSGLLSKMLFSLLLTVLPGLPPTWGLDPVTSPDLSCSQEEVCATKASCPYWLDREAEYKKGLDPSYLTSARANICNKKLLALCCPLDLQSPTFIPKAGQCGTNPEAPADQDSRFIFGGNNTQPGDYPFSALLGFLLLKYFS